MINLDQVINELKKNKNFRYNHSLGVYGIAIKIAEQFNLEKEKVGLAAWLHDYARNYNIEELKILVKNNDIKVDYWEKEIPILLHAPVSAYLAKKEYNINDIDVLNAIRYHTVGRPHMSLIEKIIFIADVIEPNRNFPGIEIIREKVNININEAVISVCDFTIKYNIEKKRLIHPNTLLIRNNLLKGEN